MTHSHAPKSGENPNQRETLINPGRQVGTVKGGGPLEDREIPVYIVTAFIVFLVAVYAALMLGLFGNPNVGGPPDGLPLPPEDRMHLEQGNTSQTLPFWTTEFFITGFWGDTSYPVGNLTFAVIAGGDAVYDKVIVNLLDLDGDDNASVGDEIVVSNMTDNVNGAELFVYLDGVIVGNEDISWNVNDPLIYSAFLYWNHPVAANGTRWDTNFSVTHLAIPFDVHPRNLSFGVVGEGGEPLDDAALVFHDWREDGILTDFDRVHVLGMTEDYQRARVCMYLDGTLVAMGTVPQWIF